MPKLDVDDQGVSDRIEELVRDCGGDPETFQGDLIKQQIQTSLKLVQEGHDLGQIKLITRSFKEMRYAYRIFNQYPSNRRVSIFGSARTAEDHPDYRAAKQFSIGMAEKGWSCITGAADGIMKAGLEGQPEESFGLSIMLPFENPSNTLIDGDPKLISFRYFFTRKLMFMSHSEALAAFPGGFGTMDELFEMLTLIQTGKGNIIPIVLVEGKDGVYWHHWEIYVKKNLFQNHMVSPDDKNLYYIAPSVRHAIDHIEKFYHNYHSSRYVRDLFVIRLKRELTDEQVEDLNRKYSKLLESKRFIMSDPLPGEDDHLELPRLVFHHTRRDYGLLRALIDEINSYS